MADRNRTDEDAVDDERVRGIGDEQADEDFEDSDDDLDDMDEDDEQEGTL